MVFIDIFQRPLSLSLDLRWSFGFVVLAFCFMLRLDLAFDMASVKKVGSNLIRLSTDCLVHQLCPIEVSLFDMCCFLMTSIFIRLNHWLVVLCLLVDFEIIADDLVIILHMLNRCIVENELRIYYSLRQERHKLMWKWKFLDFSLIWFK